MKKDNLIKILLFFYCCTLGCSCNHSQHENELQEIGLVFKKLSHNKLCDTVKKVTEGFNKK